MLGETRRESEENEYDNEALTLEVGSISIPVALVKGSSQEVIWTVSLFLSYCG